MFQSQLFLRLLFFQPQSSHNKVRPTVKLVKYSSLIELYLLMTFLMFLSLYV